MSNKHDAYITLRDAGMLSQSLSLLGTAVIFEEFAVAHISRAVEELDTRLLRVTLCLGEQAWHLLPVSTQMAQAGKQAGRQVGRQASERQARQYTKTQTFSNLLRVSACDMNMRR